MAIHRTIYTKGIFADTGGLIAIYNNADVHYNEAQLCLDTVKAKRLPIYVSTVAIIETHKRLLFDAGYLQALSFLNGIYDGSMKILRPEEQDEVEARRIIQKFYDQIFTFADAINFSIMKRYGIGKAFAFDTHYSIFGFETIPPFY